METLVATSASSCGASCCNTLVGTVETSAGAGGGGALELKTMELDITVEEDPVEDENIAALAALLLGAMEDAEADDATDADDAEDAEDAEDGPEKAALVDDAAAALLEAATKDEPVADAEDPADAGVLVLPGREDADDDAVEALLGPEKDAAPELPPSAIPTAHTPLSQRASRPQSASALHVRTHCPSTWVSSAAQGLKQPLAPAPNRSSTGRMRQTEDRPFMRPRVPRPPSQRKERHVGVGGTNA